MAFLHFFFFFFFWWISADEHSRGSLALLWLVAASMAMDPQQSSQLNPDKTCPHPRPELWAQIPSCKFALGQKRSRGPRTIITLSAMDMLREKRFFLGTPRILRTIITLSAMGMLGEKRCFLGTPRILHSSNLGMAASPFVNTVGISSDESQHEQVFV